MPSVVDDVLTALTASIAALPALSGVEVLDGPRPEAPGAADMVIVGDDGDPDSSAQVAVTQEWANLAATSRYEFGEVPCCVVSQSGDTDLTARRDRAAAVLAAIEAAVLSDLTLGGRVMVLQLNALRAQQYQNSAGSAAVLPFTITYMAQV